MSTSTDTDHLAAIAERQQHLDETEFLLRAEVSRARKAGVTWAAIGEALGVSKQAAQQRFGAIDRRTNDPSEP